jgi:hypothetical protein
MYIVKMNRNPQIAVYSIQYTLYNIKNEQNR